MPVANASSSAVEQNRKGGRDTAWRSTPTSSISERRTSTSYCERASGSGASGPTPLTRGSSRTIPSGTPSRSASPRSASRCRSGSGMAWAWTSTVPVERGAARAGTHRAVDRHVPHCRRVPARRPPALTGRKAVPPLGDHGKQPRARERRWLTRWRRSPPACTGWPSRWASRASPRSAPTCCATPTGDTLVDCGIATGPGEEACGELDAALRACGSVGRAGGAARRHPRPHRPLRPRGRGGAPQRRRPVDAPAHRPGPGEVRATPTRPSTAAS